MHWVILLFQPFIRVDELFRAWYFLWKKSWYHLENFRKKSVFLLGKKFVHIPSLYGKEIELAHSNLIISLFVIYFCYINFIGNISFWINKLSSLFKIIHFPMLYSAFFKPIHHGDKRTFSELKFSLKKNWCPEKFCANSISERTNLNPPQ